MANLLHFEAMLAAHADWSVDPRKRWIAKGYWRAERGRGGRWRLAVPEPVGVAPTLIARLADEAAGAPVAFGADFPLGLPRAYAARAGIGDFSCWLRGLAPNAALFQPCARLDEISLERPFYPKSSVAGAGQMIGQAHALGLAGPDQLRRDVDRRTHNRSAGAPMFWTMGANQCGKAALAAWRDCLLPAFEQRQPVALWPYDGAFDRLVAPGRVVLAETYPAEALVQLGLTLRGSKRRQSDRAALAQPLGVVMAALDVVPDPDLEIMLADGFGASADGEDRFDCVLGVLSMIRVLAGAPDGVHAAVPPHDPVIGAVEGWVLGQVDRPVPSTASTRRHRGRPLIRGLQPRPADPLAAGSG